MWNECETGKMILNENPVFETNYHSPDTTAAIALFLSSLEFYWSTRTHDLRQEESSQQALALRARGVSLCPLTALVPVTGERMWLRVLCSAAGSLSLFLLFCCVWCSSIYHKTPWRGREPFVWNKWGNKDITAFFRHNKSQSGMRRHIPRHIKTSIEAQEFWAVLLISSCLNFR